MHKPSNLKDYFFASVLAMGLFVLLGTYLYFRRGFLFDAPDTAGMLYVPNKVIGGVSVLMLSVVFLTGPLSRYFDKFDHWIMYRKEIGIVGAWLAIVHGVISIWLVPAKFSLGGLFALERLHIALAGVTGVLLCAALILISWKQLMQKIGGVRWWFLQRWGLRLAVLAAALHVIPMKWSGWVSWFERGAKHTPELLHPLMTPASLLVTLFLVWVVLIRLYESIFLFHSWGLKTKEISVDSVLRARGRRFFLATLCLLILSYVIMLSRGLFL